jgi:hypothetical protein
MSEGYSGWQYSHLSPRASASRAGYILESTRAASQLPTAALAGPVHKSATDKAEIALRETPVDAGPRNVEIPSERPLAPALKPLNSQVICRWERPCVAIRASEPVWLCSPPSFGSARQLALAAITFLPSLAIHPLYLNRSGMLLIYIARLVTEERDNGEKRGQLPFQSALRPSGNILFYHPAVILRDRTVFLVEVSKHGSRMRDRDNPLLIAVHAQLNNSQ